MDYTYAATHTFRFNLPEPIKFFDRDIDRLFVEIQWVDADEEGPEGWFISANLSGWPLTAKGVRDKRIKQREGLYASIYPNALWPYVSGAWTIALQRSGIDASQIVNPGEGLFNPSKWTG